MMVLFIFIFWWKERRDKRKKSYFSSICSLSTRFYLFILLFYCCFQWRKKIFVILCEKRFLLSTNQWKTNQMNEVFKTFLLSIDKKKENKLFLPFHPSVMLSSPHSFFLLFLTFRLICLFLFFFRSMLHPVTLLLFLFWHFSTQTQLIHQSVLALRLYGMFV